MTDIEIERKRLRFVDVPLVTSDPSPLVPGLIWYRTDITELRYSPDGKNIETLYKSIYRVSDTWYDATPHIFLWGTPGAGVGYPVIQIDSPTTGHKRSYESRATNAGFTCGWYVASRISILSRLNANLKVGAYNGANATRAYLETVIAFPEMFDTNYPPDRPYLRFYTTMSALRYSNGSYGQPFSGYIILTDPPQYSFSPANPSVSYKYITQLVGVFVNILYGYTDSWVANYSQWASLTSDSYYSTMPATKPPVPEYLKSFYIFGAEIHIARWDNEYRLWIKKGSSSLIVPLGKRINILNIYEHGRIRQTINKYEKLYGGIREQKQEIPLEVIEIELETDIFNLHKMSNKWRLAIMYDEETNTVYTAYGDTQWDGDKIGYIMAQHTL